ncbi:AzlD domain-containing protein [Niallia sp. 01092]|uniref:AzlD domain-containing protein n=1 Tax=unclassified Niallia TaxID=2837522 RepID=UPI003FD67185
MTITTEFLLLLLGCMLVTIIPRVLPFILVRNFSIPKPVEKWLSFIPVCIFTGLIVESLLIKDKAGLQLNWTVLLAVVPTFIVAIKTKSLLTTVLCGVFCMAVIRLLF